MPDPGTIRLVNGNTPHEGRLEIFSNNAWGTVCDDSFDIVDAFVVCSQLGFGIPEQIFYLAHFGTGTGAIVMDDLGCLGDELMITDCDHVGGEKQTHNCQHAEDVGVRCHYDPTSGKVQRLSLYTHFEWIFITNKPLLLLKLYYNIRLIVRVLINGPKNKH